MRKLDRSQLEGLITEIQNSPEKFASLKAVDIKSTDLRGLDLQYFDLYDDQINLSECILDRSEIEFLYNAGRTNFANIIVRDETLGYIHKFEDITGTDYEETFYVNNVNFSGARFENCNFADVCFVNTNLTNVMIDNCSNLEQAYSLNCDQNGISQALPEVSELPQHDQYSRGFFQINISFLNDMFGDCVGKDQYLALQEQEIDISEINQESIARNIDDYVKK